MSEDGSESRCLVGLLLIPLALARLVVAHLAARSLTHAAPAGPDPYANGGGA